jgi:hypothetical protein
MPSRLTLLHVFEQANAIATRDEQVLKGTLRF